MTGKIFINYRRGDDPGFAQALFARLEQVFPPEKLFMDVDNIEPGLDFVEVLKEQVAQCDVLISIIGKGWTDARDETGARRLENPADFVRIEIELGLAQRKRVIPVLVGETRMPHADELPEPMKSLATRNAVRLTHERFRSDVQGLIVGLQRALKSVEDGRAAQAEAERHDGLRREAEAEERRKAHTAAERREAEQRREEEEERQRQIATKAERQRLEREAAARKEAAERVRQAAAAEAERKQSERDAAVAGEADKKARQEERRRQEEDERQRRETEAEWRRAEEAEAAARASERAARERQEAPPPLPLLSPGQRRTLHPLILAAIAVLVAVVIGGIYVLTSQNNMAPQTTTMSPQTSTKASALEFDGTYTGAVSSVEPVPEYFRFYEDGTVIYHRGGGWTPTQSSFTKASSQYYPSKYTESGDSISFSITDQYGAIDYQGTIVPSQLNLNWHSHINNASGTEILKFQPW
jgi:chemotaxis protein histidine kinase CheA